MLQESFRLVNICKTAYRDVTKKYFLDNFRRKIKSIKKKISRARSFFENCRAFLAI